MRHASLFSGIGGFDLTARWMGWINVFHCEQNPFCQTVLKHHFPEAEGHGDITKTDFTKYANTIDILTGGWPCQKYSIAGAKSGNEPLKEDLIRAVREIKPRYCVLENVGNFIGKQFAHEHSELCKRLEDMGYTVQTFDIDAASCGLPTMERHIWIVAQAHSVGQKGSVKKAVQDKSALPRELSGGYTGDTGRWVLPESRVCDLGKGIPDGLAGISFSKWHGEAIQAIGNAIPPQVAFQIFKAIQEANNA